MIALFQHLQLGNLSMHKCGVPLTKTLDPIWARMFHNVQLVTSRERFYSFAVNSSPATKTSYCERFREGPREAQERLMEDYCVDALLLGFFSQTL